ncbi:MAG: YbdK family carboxylate-amine ligase [Rhodocyclaceae bacterium]|nr:YbdK family carboxylate-amine ligase [Rhodocyclaceae bacterium]MBL0076709.1 YbdK family carboxylate-amine ligase [Rhodocyclaceae bacterium]MBP6109767.1 YbdK family carboxylate-amine ligase [Rhodocyclaceae bacterium]MBP6278227.1 YbdK family carboxylate-amine ligase [Rhodocyclaceae bacterium]
MLDFAKSAALTFGMELEFQLVNAETGILSPSSLAFMEALAPHPDISRFALEATLSTMELNTSIHHDADSMMKEATELTQTLCDIALPMELLIRGGGTQMTQFWNERSMAPTPRAAKLTERFGFLPKRFSTYGMHVHIGVESADDAIRLGNVLQALSPLFIAMSAASPFLQMADTGFVACRPLEPLMYPHGGPMPRLESWDAFEHAASEIFSTGLADSLKDIYWDVRPKPEFGTIEVRVFDTPLCVHKAVALAAFTRACASLALQGALKLPPQSSPATAERVSRFMACRDGLDADLFDPLSQQWLPARKWLDMLVEAVCQSPVCDADLTYILALRQHCAHAQDAQLMRTMWRQSGGPEGDLAEYSQSLSALLLGPMSEVEV